MRRRIAIDEASLNHIRNSCKEVGHGSDGKVYKYDKDHLIKFYRKQLKVIDNEVYDNDNTKVYVLKKNRSPEDKTDYGDLPRRSYGTIQYFLDEDENNSVRLAPEDAIKAAIQRQGNIKRTELPKSAVYSNGHFVGCIVKKLRGIGIHKLSMLPLSAKKKIINNLLDDMEELLNNHIYHRDLSNSPYASVSYVDEAGNDIRERGHSHVLVNPFTLGTHIIDLDGKSTIYRESYSEKYEKEAIRELLVLIIEYVLSVDLYDYELVENENSIDNPYLTYLSTYYNLSPSDTIEYIFNNNSNLENVRTLVKNINTK